MFLLIDEFFPGTRLSHDHGHGHSTFKKVTFDEACVPEGCWKENFAKKQRKYNAQLAVGVTAFVLTIFSVSILLHKLNIIAKLSIWRNLLIIA